MTSFSALGLAEPLLRAVEACGYTEPTPIQAQAIPPLLAGRDLLGGARTGTGKTAAFTLPVLQHLLQRPSPGPRRTLRALVLTPTRELAAQIGESFARYGQFTPVRHAVIFGGVGQYPQVEALRSGLDVLVACPGRLLDLHRQGFLDLNGVELFVLDEADRMLDMGFLPDVRRVLALLPRKRQNLLFSATLPRPIVDLAGAFLRDPVSVEVHPNSSAAEAIEQLLVHVRRAEKPRLLAALLRGPDVERALVFTRTKHGADKVVKFLDQEGIPAMAIHGNKRQTARTRAMDAFREGTLPVLVATDVASRGIDVDDVTHVIQVDLPNEPEVYVHRIGRTGRAGRTGVAIAFCDPEERPLLAAIERLLRAPVPVAEVEPVGQGPAWSAGPPEPSRRPEPARAPRPAPELAEGRRRRPRTQGENPSWRQEA